MLIALALCVSLSFFIFIFYLTKSWIPQFATLCPSSFKGFSTESTLRGVRWQVFLIFLWQTRVYVFGRAEPIHDLNLKKPNGSAKSDRWDQKALNSLSYLPFFFPQEQFKKKGLNHFSESPLHRLYRESESIPFGQRFRLLRARPNKVRHFFISHPIKFLKAHGPADEFSVQKLWVYSHGFVVEMMCVCFFFFTVYIYWVRQRWLNILQVLCYALLFLCALYFMWLF